MWNFGFPERVHHEPRPHTVNSFKTILTDSVVLIAASIFANQAAKNFERESPGLATILQFVPIIASILWIARRFKGLTNFNFRQFMPARNPGFPPQLRNEHHHHHHQAQGGGPLYPVPNRRPDNGVPHDYVPPPQHRPDPIVRPNQPIGGNAGPNPLYPVPDRRPDAPPQTTYVPPPSTPQSFTTQANIPPRQHRHRPPDQPIGGNILHPVPNRRPGDPTTPNRVDPPIPPRRDTPTPDANNNGGNPLHAVPNRRPLKGG